VTWKTQWGERHAVGAEAELFREAIAYVLDMVLGEIEDPDEKWSFQVPVFDRVHPASKLGLLASVGEALLSETPSPPLTAITEGTVAALYNAVKQLVAIESDDQRLDEAEGSASRQPRHRSLVLEVARSHDVLVDDSADPSLDTCERLPAVHCTDLTEWEWVVDAISDHFLWDQDFLYADEMLDADPDIAGQGRERLGITRGYYLDDAPDPEVIDVASTLKRLKELLRMPKAG
jgi:hypothetical protein